MAILEDNYTVELSRSDAIGLLPVLDYLHSDVLTASEYEQPVLDYADYWRRRIAYTLHLPIKSIIFEIQPVIFDVIDQAIECVQIGPYERAIWNTVSWAIHKQVTNRVIGSIVAKSALSPDRYKVMLHTKTEFKAYKL